MAAAAFGQALELGIGVNQNLEAAAAWLKTAALAGSGRAANSLGKMFFDGRGVQEVKLAPSKIAIMGIAEPCPVSTLD
eukprot:scaffold462561_cov54-Prasinocladus_malaysianus.AAC.1